MFFYFFLLLVDKNNYLFFKRNLVINHHVNYIIIKLNINQITIILANRSLEFVKLKNQQQQQQKQNKHKKSIEETYINITRKRYIQINIGFVA